MEYTLIIRVISVDVVGSDTPHCMARGFSPPVREFITAGVKDPGQLIIQSKVHPTHSVEAQTAAKREITDWVRDNRPDWSIIYDGSGVDADAFSTKG